MRSCAKPPHCSKERLQGAAQLFGVRWLGSALVGGDFVAASINFKTEAEKAFSGNRPQTVKFAPKEFKIDLLQGKEIECETQC
jgi:hypothetical protein